MHKPMHTPLDKMARWAERTPTAPALYRPSDAGWQTITWKAYFDNVCAVSDALIALGLNKDDCIVILSGNRVEWLYAQFGIGLAGCVVTPCYATNLADQVAYQVGHCKAPLIFVEDADQLAKLTARRDQLPHLHQVVVFDGDSLGHDVDREWVMTFADFLGLGTVQHTATRNQRWRSLRGEERALIIYTSGTTGQPKGVLISYGDLMELGGAVLERFPATSTRTISYLPLCHIAEQTASNLVQLETGGEVFVCSDVSKMKDYLPQVRPTVLFGVPRIWEKIESALRDKFNQGGRVKRYLIGWARGAELAAVQHYRETGKERWTFSRRLAHRLVIAKVQDQLGIDRVQYAVTGAAPISRRSLDFFASLGLRIQEVYGLSETTGVLTATIPTQIAIGTVGKPLRKVEIKIAADGEILCRGSGLTTGYLDDPEATAELWQGGWMHTGDVGYLDEDGNLVPTDRKKDIIVTAGGKNIAPQPLQEQLQGIRGIAQTVVIGDRRPYLVALLTLDQLAAPMVAEDLGITAQDPASLAIHPAFVGYVQGKVDKINAGLARYQAIKRFELLPAEFSIAGGELTPTMKIKRRVVTEKFATVIDGLYASA